MMDEGTLSYYDRNAYGYAALTASADMSAYTGRFLSLLGPCGRILDLGAGSGRDSLFFLSCGYEVTSVDGSAGLCRIAPVPMRCLRFEDLDYAGEFDGVWASASLLHLPSSELPDVLRRIDRALVDGGVFFSSFMHGAFEGERDGRHYTDMSEERMLQLLHAAGTDLSILGCVVSEDALGRGGRWIAFYMRKRGCVCNNATGDRN